MRFLSTLSAVLPVVSVLAADVETGSQPELDLSVLTSHQAPCYPVTIRVPPTLSNGTSTSASNYVPTPGDWFLGTWYFSYSNSASYQTYLNMQWTIYPTSNFANDGSLQDLTTFQLLNSSDSTVWAIYGVDNRTVVNGETASDCYDFHPTGDYAPFFNTYEIIAWGYDESGVPFSVLYETAAAGQTTPSFDIISRSDSGPSNSTLTAIYAGVAAVHSDALNALIPNVMPIAQNGGRNGQPYPTCDALCESNTVNPYGF
ncbi:hypothetical protein B7494_g1671 [Chlorociboria aeruginascens]|nr:hypothetical protein B7494_g1671 [Chlorociboria aeruginascens]